MQQIQTLHYHKNRYPNLSHAPPPSNPHESHLNSGIILIAENTRKARSNLITSQDIHDLLNLDILLGTTKSSQVDIEINGDIARQPIDITTKDRITGLNSTAHLVHPVLKIHILPLPPDTIKVGMVKIESRVSVGSERIRSRSTDSPMTSTMDTRVDEVGLGLKREGERAVVGLRLDESLLLSGEPAGAEIGEEVAGEAARVSTSVGVHSDVDLPVGEGAIFNTVIDVALLLGLAVGDHAVGAEAVDGVPDLGLGVVGGVAGIVPVTGNGIS